MVEYLDNGDVAVFNGYSFRKDKKTGYFLSSKPINGKRKRLHIVVWGAYNGEIPKGKHVHHKDHDKSNNCIENLQLLNKKEHLKYHGANITDERREQLIKNLRENARPKANKWHSSTEGKEWHRKMAIESWGKRVDIEYICTQCGKSFTTKNIYAKNENRFCCNNCKSAYRRKMGDDNIKKKCEKCGGEYIANKYAHTKRCKDCKNKEIR